MLPLTIPQTILQHLRKTSIANLQLLLSLQIHEIHLLDAKHPQKLPKISKSVRVGIISQINVHKMLALVYSCLYLNPQAELVLLSLEGLDGDWQHTVVEVFLL